jgi:hypothetical protein
MDHSVTIVRPGALASAACLLAACRAHPRPAPDPAATPAPVTVRTLAPGDAFLLENAGGDPQDTVALLVPGRARTIVLRHPAPDQTVFATLDVPAAGLAAGPDSVPISLAPAPGVYGVTIGCDAPFGPGITLTFKYAVHFGAPAAAIARYGSRIGLERRLAIARRNDDGSYAMLASGRPASDDLSALISAPGTYVVVAPR